MPRMAKPLAAGAPPVAEVSGPIAAAHVACIAVDKPIDDEGAAPQSRLPPPADVLDPKRSSSHCCCDGADAHTAPHQTAKGPRCSNAAAGAAVPFHHMALAALIVNEDVTGLESFLGDCRRRSCHLSMRGSTCIGGDAEEEGGETVEAMVNSFASRRSWKNAAATMAVGEGEAEAEEEDGVEGLTALQLALLSASSEDTALGMVRALVAIGGADVNGAAKSFIVFESNDNNGSERGDDGGDGDDASPSSPCVVGAFLSGGDGESPHADTTPASAAIRAALSTSLPTALDLLLTVPNPSDFTLANQNVLAGRLRVIDYLLSLRMGRVGSLGDKHNDATIAAGNEDDDDDDDDDDHVSVGRAAAAVLNPVVCRENNIIFHLFNMDDNCCCSGAGGSSSASPSSWHFDTAGGAMVRLLRALCCSSSFCGGGAIADINEPSMEEAFGAVTPLYLACKNPMIPPAVIEFMIGGGGYGGNGSDGTPIGSNIGDGCGAAALPHVDAVVGSPMRLFIQSRLASEEYDYLRATTAAASSSESSLSTRTASSSRSRSSYSESVVSLFKAFRRAGMDRKAAAADGGAAAAACPNSGTSSSASGHASADEAVDDALLLHYAASQRDPLPLFEYLLSPPPSSSSSLAGDSDDGRRLRGGVDPNAFLRRRPLSTALPTADDDGAASSSPSFAHHYPHPLSVVFSPHVFPFMPSADAKSVVDCFVKAGGDLLICRSDAGEGEEGDEAETSVSSVAPHHRGLSSQHSIYLFLRATGLAAGRRGGKRDARVKGPRGAADDHHHAEDEDEDEEGEAWDLYNPKRRTKKASATAEGALDAEEGESDTDDDGDCVVEVAYPCTPLEVAIENSAVPIAVVRHMLLLAMGGGRCCGGGTVANSGTTPQQTPTINTTLVWCPRRPDALGAALMARDWSAPTSSSAPLPDDALHAPEDRFVVDNFTNFVRFLVDECGLDINGTTNASNSVSPNHCCSGGSLLWGAVHYVMVHGSQCQSGSLAAAHQHDNEATPSQQQHGLLSGRALLVRALIEVFGADPSRLLARGQRRGEAGSTARGHDDDEGLDALRAVAEEASVYVPSPHSPSLSLAAADNIDSTPRLVVHPLIAVFGGTMTLATCLGLVEAFLCCSGGGRSTAATDATDSSASVASSDPFLWIDTLPPTALDMWKGQQEGHAECAALLLRRGWVGYTD